MRRADESAREAQWRAARAPQGIHPEPEAESRELSAPYSSSWSRGVRGGWESAFKSPQAQTLLGPPGSPFLSPSLPTPVSWRRSRWVLSSFLPRCCSHFPWDAGKHLRGAEMKSYPLASRHRFRALPQHLDSSSTRKVWGILALAFIMQSQPFPRGIIFVLLEDNKRWVCTT